MGKLSITLSIAVIITSIYSTLTDSDSARILVQLFLGGIVLTTGFERIKEERKKLGTINILLGIVIWSNVAWMYFL
ncbi:DUF3953 domain-containing protein [Bacillus manliponensis]|uniref:DUF3953 domain-containing protein n=1 Tax=Bacillus manliponensis TaxID=574376 RepID=UPI003515137A